MTLALRYILLGALVATVVSLWNPAWWVVLIAFWIGTVCGLFVTLMDFGLSRLWERFEK